MIKKLFFITTLFLLTSFSDSYALTETQTQQTIETETTKIEKPGAKETSQKTPIKQLTNKKDFNYLLELYANDKWGFMGKKFIDEWEWKYDSSKARINIVNFDLFLIFLTPIIMGVSAIIIYNNYEIQNKLRWLGYNDESQCFRVAVIELITAIIIGIIVTKLGSERIDRKVIERNYQTIKDFLDRWQTYKHITTKELFPLFEKLIQNFDELMSGDYVRIINEIQQQVRNNHSVYYEEYKQSITKPPVINNYYYH